MTSEHKPADNRIFWIQETDPEKDAALVKRLNDIIDRSIASHVASVRRPRSLDVLGHSSDRTHDLPSLRENSGRRPFTKRQRFDSVVFDPITQRFRAHPDYDMKNVPPLVGVPRSSITSKSGLPKTTEVESTETPSTPARAALDSTLALKTPGPASIASSSDILAVTPATNSTSTLSIAPPAAPSKKRASPVTEISAKVKRTGETQSVAEARVGNEDKKLSDEGVNEQTDDGAKEKNEQEDGKHAKSNTQTSNNADMESIKDADVNNITTNRRTKKNN